VATAARHEQGAVEARLAANSEVDRAGMLIALVGEQPLPNFLPVRFYKPAAVLFVYTERTKRVYDRLYGNLNGEAQIHGLEVEPYDIGAVATKLQTRLVVGS
jgi:hypothetical protein